MYSYTYAYIYYTEMQKTAQSWVCCIRSRGATMIAREICMENNHIPVQQGIMAEVLMSVNSSTVKHNGRGIDVSEVTKQQVTSLIPHD